MIERREKGREGEKGKGKGEREGEREPEREGVRGREREKIELEFKLSSNYFQVTIIQKANDVFCLFA